jgi:anaerobic dimethyl sulfoxide reductase subunit C (anchor subunit)
MNLREWALIIFTILAQMASGSMLVLMVIRSYLASKAKTEEVDGLLNGPTLIVVPLMGLALLASLLHLNNLVNVVRAVPNLGSSWLSREVVLGVVFMVLTMIYTFMQWRTLGSSSQRTILGWLTALVGVVQTYAMGMVYMIRTQPAWNTLATPVTFFVTSLLLGGLAVAVAMLISQAQVAKKDSQIAEKQLPLLRSVIQGIALGAVLLLGVEFLVLPVYMAYLATQGSAASQSLMLMVGPYLGTLVLRLLLIFVGAGILATYLYRSAGLPGREKAMATLTYSAFALVLVGEVMGRILFYASHVRIGL